MTCWSHDNEIVILKSSPMVRNEYGNRFNVIYLCILFTSSLNFKLNFMNKQ